MKNIKSNMKKESRNFNKKKALFIFVAFLLALVQIVLLNQHSESGEELSKLQDEISKIRLENKKLSKKIASSSSMTTLLDQAKENGLGGEAKMVSMDQPLPIALNQ